MKRINLWSGPRNISTATMYSFAQRKDTTVVDEPLYAHYLSKTPAFDYHPGAAKVLATQENDGKKVIEMMLGNQATPIVFFKHMAHHLVGLDWSFMNDCTNIILTRNPREMIPSFGEQIEAPSLNDLGYLNQIKILNHLKKLGQEIIVLESKQVLLNPRKVLSELCERIDIPFDEKMLSWEAGARPEDGSWAEFWYKSVHRSTGFAPYQPKTTPFPEKLEPLYQSAKPLYDELASYAIMA
jgi:hypothetical protein